MSRENIMSIKYTNNTPPPPTSPTRDSAHNSPTAAAVERQKRPAAATCEDPDGDQENLGRGRRKRVKTAKAIESESRSTGARALAEAANTINIGTRTASPGDEQRATLNTSKPTETSKAPNARPRTASPALERSSTSTDPAIELSINNKLKGALSKVLKKTTTSFADETTAPSATEASNAIPAANALTTRRLRYGGTRTIKPPPQVTTRSARETRPREHRNSAPPDKSDQKVVKKDADLDRANRITESGPYDKSEGTSNPRKIDAQKEPSKHLERYLRHMALPEENVLGRREFLRGKIEEELEWVLDPTFRGRGQNGAKMFVGYFWHEFHLERPWAKDWEKFKRERIQAATGDTKRIMINAYWKESRETQALEREAARQETAAIEQARWLARAQLTRQVHRLAADALVDVSDYRGAIILMRMRVADDDEAEDAATNLVTMSGALPDDEPNGPDDESATSSDREW